MPSQHFSVGFCLMVGVDSGNGYVDSRSVNLTKAGHGLYFHLAVEGEQLLPSAAVAKACCVGGKQLTENVPPSRIYRTLEQYRKRNATKIVIVNSAATWPL